MHKLILVIITFGLFMSLGGCVNPQFAESINLLRDDSFTVGCVTDEIKARGGLGVWGQSGDMEGSVCKLKCSLNLPPGYCFEYDNPATGCKAKAGTGCGDEPQEVIIVQPKPKPIVRVQSVQPAINRKPIAKPSKPDFDPFGKAPKDFN